MGIGKQGKLIRFEESLRKYLYSAEGNYDKISRTNWFIVSVILPS